MSDKNYISSASDCPLYSGNEPTGVTSHMVTENINKKSTGFTLDRILNLIELLFKHLKHKNQTTVFLLESNNYQFKNDIIAAKYLALHELDTKIHDEIECLMKKINGKKGETNEN
jgi:hypothetical protein